MLQKFIEKKCSVLRYFEPVPVPKLDEVGNVIGYEYPKVVPLPFAQTEQYRKKKWPNELGMSANPENVEGFRVLVDIIQQNRNLRGSGVFDFCSDDVASFYANQRLDDAIKEFNDNNHE